jgi:hypothetical protein
MLGTSLQKRLRIEALEEKIALAGDVTVAVINGDLVITGDAADNSLVVERANYYNPLEDHQIRIKGTELTNINGVTDQWIFFDGLTRDMQVNLGNGSDTIHIYGLDSGLDGDELFIPRDLVVNMGNGDDHVVLGVTPAEEFYYTGDPNPDPDFQPLHQSPLGVGRDITINLGSGADSVLFASTVVGDDLSISDSSGNTEIIEWTIANWISPNVTTSIGDDVNITLGGGDDYVDLLELTIGGDVIYDLGGGADYAALQGFTSGGSVLVNAGAGANEVVIGSGTIGGGVLLTGSGSNTFQVDVLDVASSIVVLTGNNDDTLYISNSNAGSAIVTTGGGSDYVQLADSAFTLLTVSLGAGSDTLSMDGVSSKLAILLGGGGSDTLLESADNNFLLAIDTSFETFGAI